MRSGGGTQPQRTALAWSRTALGAAGVAGAEVKVAANRHGAVFIVCAVIAGLCAAGLFACGQLRARYEQGARQPHDRIFRAAAACAVLSAAAAAVLTLLPPA